MRYRSSALKMAERHCPRVLDHLDRGDPADSEVFDLGVAAHAVLQAAGAEADKLDRALTDAGRKQIARRVVSRLTVRGRSFDGRPQPPPRPIAVRQGADLALEWLADRGESIGHVEHGLAMDRDGEPVPYRSPEAWYRGIVDSLGRSTDGLYDYLDITDYKTSWRDGEELLASMQLRGYAVLAWIHGLAEGVEEIRLHIANLRRRAVYTETVPMLHESGPATLREWRQDLLDYLQELDAARREAGEGHFAFPARPGGGCPGCPFLGRCEPAQELLRVEKIPGDSVEAARLYGAWQARHAQLEGHLKRITAWAPIEVGGRALGHHPAPRRRPSDLAVGKVWATWANRGGDARGLLAAMGLGVGNINKIAKQLFEGVDEREKWIEDVTEEAPSKRFGWRPIEPRDDA